MRAVVFGYLLAVSGSAAVAQAPREMTTIWLVQPAVEITGQTVEVSRGDFLLKQRALPSGLARLTGELSTPDGKRHFTANHELFEVKSDMPIYCAVQARAQSGLEKWLTEGATKQFCLVDSNSDLQFDAYFEPISQIPGLPTISGKRPKKLKPLSPVPYAMADASTMQATYWIGIEYQGKPLIYDRLNFAVAFGSEVSKGSLTDWVYTSGSKFPASSGLLGAKFTVLDNPGGKIKVRIDQPMPPQPFGVMRTTTYRIY
jgi:hypothetical protein